MNSVLNSPDSGLIGELVPDAPPPPAEPVANAALPRQLQAIGLGGLAASLVACGGGGEDAPAAVAPPTPAPTPAPAPAPAPKPTVEEAGRFLTQATLGFSQTDLNALTSSSYSDWLDTQFALPRSAGHCDWLTASGYNAATNINNTTGLDNTIWRKLISAGDPLRQRVVLALSEVCVVSVLGINSQWRQYAVGNYLDILEAQAFGNYRTLLQQITLSTAMGYYLTYRGNVKANATTGSQPDENYARELMQLFTIGLVQLNPDGSVKTNAQGAAIESFVPADVSGLARVFTGWNLDLSGLTSPYPPDIHIRPMVSTANTYESGSKTFLGATIAAGTLALDGLNMALDTLFNHPNLPPFVGKQLIQRLVTSNPSPAYIARVSAVFANNGSGVRGDLKAVIRAILLDTEARDAKLAASATYGKLREPMVRFLNWARAYNASSPSGSWNVGDLSDPTSRLGQSPMRSGSVFNFFRPGYVPPNTGLATQGLTAPEFQITNETTISGYVNFMQRAVTGAGVGDLTPDYSSLLPLAANAPALLSAVNQVLAGSQVSAATLATIQTAVGSMPFATAAQLQNRVYAALVLVLASPEFIAQK